MFNFFYQYEWFQRFPQGIAVFLPYSEALQNHFFYKMIYKNPLEHFRLSCARS